mmetsp:Transcript_9626/g.12541  ORF Transcript_9626/g.12541 Transcript_9626/m.12541 type:complete len:314 (+) Transcript_9626:326-1267(+)
MRCDILCSSLSSLSFMISSISFSIFPSFSLNCRICIRFLMGSMTPPKSASDDAVAMPPVTSGTRCRNRSPPTVTAEASRAAAWYREVRISCVILSASFFLSNVPNTSVTDPLSCESSLYRAPSNCESWRVPTMDCDLSPGRLPRKSMTDLAWLRDFSSMRVAMSAMSSSNCCPVPLRTSTSNWLLNSSESIRKESLLNRKFAAKKSSARPTMPCNAFPMCARLIAASLSTSTRKAAMFCSTKSTVARSVARTKRRFFMRSRAFSVRLDATPNGLSSLDWIFSSADRPSRSADSTTPKRDSSHWLAPPPSSGSP